MRVRGGGGARHVGGGGATTHISTESKVGGGAVRRWLELPTSCIREGGGVVRRWLELPTSWCKGGRAVRLEGEANLPYQSRACLFVIKLNNTMVLLIIQNLLIIESIFIYLICTHSGKSLHTLHSSSIHSFNLHT
jgi:hypothetical protein